MDFLEACRLFYRGEYGIRRRAWDADSLVVRSLSGSLLLEKGDTAAPLCLSVGDVLAEDWEGVLMKQGEDNESDCFPDHHR